MGKRAIEAKAKKPAEPKEKKPKAEPKSKSKAAAKAQDIPTTPVPWIDLLWPEMSDLMNQCWDWWDATYSL